MGEDMTPTKRVLWNLEERSPSLFMMDRNGEREVANFGREKDMLGSRFGSTYPRRGGGGRIDLQDPGYQKRKPWATC